jgi:protein-disulfide isomerase
MSNGKPTSTRRRVAEEAARRRRTRNIMIGVVFVIVVAVGAAVWASHKTSPDASAANPAGVLDDLGIPVGTATSPVVDVYEDFQCPICKMLEANVGPTFQELADSGQARVVYHIMSFLDYNLNNDSSTRAANAAGCAQDQGVFPAYHQQVFANQPETEGQGYTDAQLITFAQNAGVPDMARFQSCLTNQTFSDWVAQTERLAEDKQVNGTPTIFVAGTKVDLSQATSWDDFIAQLKAAVQQAS